MTLPERGVPRRIDIDAEAARLAEARKAATEKALRYCRFCFARDSLESDQHGWRCEDSAECFRRMSGASSKGSSGE